jgi:carbonic anhydrase
MVASPSSARDGGARLKLDVHRDLGLRRLLPEWRSMFSIAYLKDDLVAGITVACVAIPLSLAIALASGVAPAVGLVTAIVGGIVCGLFGGTRLAVSGPAAAMAILVASLVQEHGLPALLVVIVGSGLLQLATGALGLGRFIRLVPLPVVEGFTAGIGAIILIGQIPRALGLPPPPANHVFDVVTHIVELLEHTRPASVLIAIGSLAVIYLLPRISRRTPPHIVAVALATLAVFVFGVDAQAIGPIPRSLPAPKIPELTGISLPSLVVPVLVVYALASLETLLSSAAVDKLATGPRSDPDQELIGQGLGNVASALFGGIAVTGVIARSATNVQAGAKTRRSTLVQALALIVVVFVAAPLIGRIPIAALAAVLFSVAFRMLDPRSFRRLWAHSRGDGMVYAITFVVIVFVGLLEGVQWGFVASLVIAAVRLGRTRMVVRGARAGEHYMLQLEGPLTFMSSLDVEVLRHELDILEPSRGVVIDLHGLTMMDASGASMLAGILAHARAVGLKPVLVGLTEERRTKLLPVAGPDLEGAVASSQREAMELLGESTSADHHLRAGIDRYRRTLRPSYARLFAELAEGQAPHTLFITCSDSRIDPNLITGTEPGDLFIVRDVGALVPPSLSSEASSVGAAVEYAVGILGVRKIVVCGHSGCGAIKALLAGGDRPLPYPNLEAWLEGTGVRDILRSLPRALGTDEVARLVVLAQIDRLRTYRVVEDAIASGELSLAPWFFDVGCGELEEWSAETQRFRAIRDEEDVGAPPPPSEEARH